MESQFDPGECPVADLPADHIESNSAPYDQLLDGLLVLAHISGELLQGSEVLCLLILRPSIRAVRQAVEAVVEPGARHLVLASRHFCSRLKIVVESLTVHLM